MLEGFLDRNDVTIAETEKLKLSRKSPEFLQRAHSAVVPITRTF
jgi:hypothetical protein